MEGPHGTIYTDCNDRDIRTDRHMEGDMKKLLIATVALGLALLGCEIPDNYDQSDGLAPSNMNLRVYGSSDASASARAADRGVTTEFYVGLQRQDVFDTLGDPDYIFYGNDLTYTPGVDYDADAYHVYHAVGLSFRIFGDTVREITLLNDDWIASNGLIVGMTMNEMLEILGDPARITETDNKDFYQYEEYDIMVEIYKPAYDVGEININEGNAE